jgi:short-subunit dehydrogenase
MNGRSTALVTGASGGLGLELARVLAGEGHDLILVARREDKLEQLAAELRSTTTVTVLPTDLARDDAVPELTDELEARGLAVDVLVNNAGFTQFGPFAQLDEQELLDLLHVNVVALSRLTRRLLPGMLERGRGRVLNMSSNAAFQPGPLMAAYYASKVYVLNFSLALTEEVRGSGVTVTAVCPGPTRTGFQARASMEDSKLVAGRKLAGAADVAAWAWSQAKAGRPFAVHSLRWRAFAFGTRLLPRSFAARSVMSAQSRVGS